MARGDHYPGERRWFRDPATGTLIWQLTAYNAHSTKLSYTTPSWTPDGEWIVFFGELSWGRDSPYGLFKAGSDGRVIVQLSDSPVRFPFAAIDAPRNRVLFPSGDEIRSVDLTTCDERTVAGFESASNWGGMTIDPEWRHALTTFTWNGLHQLVRLDLETDTPVEILADAQGFSRAQYCGDGSGMIRFSGSTLATRPDIVEHQALWIIEEGDEVPSTPLIQGADREITHDSWLGRSREILFVQCEEPHPPEAYPSSIRAVDVDTGYVRLIADRGSYWHCSASPDGRRIVSDTNWPQRGLLLIDARTGQERTLCWPGESGGPRVWGHPHPSFSPDGTRVLYNSDATGISQLYVAAVDE